MISHRPLPTVVPKLVTAPYLKPSTISQIVVIEQTKDPLKYTTAMASSAINSTENSALLVQLCVKVLKNIAPQGMTTKELAAELDNQVVPGLEGISSPILSSKLNAVFRRSHKDSHNPNNEQLSELPLTRSQSNEIPRRLVYRYSPPANPNAESDNTKSGANRSSKRSRSNSVEERESQQSEDEMASSVDEPTEPLTPKEEHPEESTWPSAKRRMTDKVLSTDAMSPSPSISSSSSSSSASSHTIQSQNDSSKATTATTSSKCPDTPPSTSSDTSRKAQALAGSHSKSSSKLNLYYDAVGYDTVTAAFTPATPLYSPTANDSGNTLTSSLSLDPNNDADSWSDFASPEDLGLNELDKLVC